MRADTLISGHTLFYKVSAEAPHCRLSPLYPCGYLGGHFASGHFLTCVRPSTLHGRASVDAKTTYLLRTQCPDTLSLAGGGHSPPSLEGACPSGCPSARRKEQKQHPGETDVRIE